MRLLLLLLLLASPAEAQIRTRWASADVQATPPNPSVLIEVPTTASTYSTSQAALNLAGSADDNVSVVSVTWACATCTPTSGTATGTTSWAFSLTLAEGANTITVTATDGDSNTGQDSLVATLSSNDVTAPTVTITTNGGANFSTVNAQPSLSGTCTDTVGCTLVQWSNALGGSGTCSGTGNWTCALTLTATSGQTTANAITITGSDQAGNEGTDTITITLVVTLALTTNSLGQCTLNQACTITLTAAGGTQPYTFSKVSGTYLTGTPAFALNASTGAITGTCTTGGQTETGHVYRVTDAAEDTDDSDSLTMRCVDPAAETYFQTIAGLSTATAITGCTAVDAKGCSLQNGQQLLNLAQNPSQVQAYTYDSSMNAALLDWPQEMASVESTIEIPVFEDGDEVVVVWDFRPQTPWLRAECGGVVDRKGYTHKEFNFKFAHSGDTSNGAITWEIRYQWAHTNACATFPGPSFQLRTYTDLPETDASLAINNANTFNAGSDKTAGPGTLALDQYAFATGQWNRCVAYFRLNQTQAVFSAWNTKYSITVPTGIYHDTYLWCATESNDFQRLAFNLPLRRANKSAAVTTLSRSGTTATLVTATDLTLAVGERVNIKGANEAAYNGDFTVLTRTTVAPFTYTFAIASGSDSATGTITASKIRDQFNVMHPQHNTSSSHDKAKGNVTFTCASCSGTIPKGTVLTKPAGGGCAAWQFKTDVDKTWSGGSATVAVTAEPGQYGGPCGNTTAGTALGTTISGATAAVAAGDLSGGDYLLDGDIQAHARWVNVLKGSGLMNVAGANSAADVTNNSTLLQKPQP